MRHTTPIPTSLGDSFHVRDAVSAGVGVDRCDARDLFRPFRGVRSIRPIETFDDRVKAHAARMKPGQRLCGRSAARAFGLPVPGAWNDDLEVCVPPTCASPRSAGVKGRRLKPERARTYTWRGVPLIDPIAALFTCATTLTTLQIVVMIDALLSDAGNYPGRHRKRVGVLATRAEIEKRLDEWGSFPGRAAIRAALELAREKVESPKETETRLLIVDAGLPEPVVQFVVREDGRFIARVDLAYPDLKIAIEYDGDGHRTDKEQWRSDIRRNRELEELGWLVIHLTQEDLDDGRESLLRRIRHDIAARLTH